MRIEEKFTVSASADAVWAFLIDPERVAAALPGAEITEKLDETTYKGGMAVKVGPLERRLHRHRRLRSRRGESLGGRARQGPGQGRNGQRRHEDDQQRPVARRFGEAEVTVVADLTVTGILAQLGRGMMQHVSKKMFKEFTEVLGKELRMIPPQFDYHAPGSLEEALAPPRRSLDDAKVMSGGQSLLPMLKLRLATPANIVDIGRIPGLDSDRRSPAASCASARWSPRRRSKRTRPSPSASRSSSTPPRSSPTRSCGTAPPSAATSPTAIRPTTTRPP